MRALWRMIVKEFQQMRRDRKIIPSLIIGPLLQLLALGFAANNDVTNVRLLLVDQDRTSASRRLVDRFTASGYFELVGSVDTPDRVDPWLVEGRAQIVLVIPERFGADVAAHRTPKLQVIADGTESNSAIVGLGYASGIIRGLGLDLAATRGSVNGPRIELRQRVWYNPDLKSRWFYLPAILAMVLMLVTMILPSVAVVREKEIGTLEQLIVTPIRSWQIIVGKLLPFGIIGVLDLCVITAIVHFGFGVPLRGSFFFLLAMTLLFLTNTLGLGLLVSSMVRTQQQAMLSAVFLLMVPMIYLSGLIFPIENMPHVIQVGTYAVPLRYYNEIIRGVFLKGSGITALWPEAVTLAAFGMAVLTVASLRFRKTLD